VYANRDFLVKCVKTKSDYGGVGIKRQTNSRWVCEPTKLNSCDNKALKKDLKLYDEKKTVRYENEKKNELITQKDRLHNSSMYLFSNKFLFIHLYKSSYLT
jgi:hypothetical protein